MSLTGTVGVYLAEARRPGSSRRGPLTALRAASPASITYYLSIEVAITHGNGADGRWSYYHAREIAQEVAHLLHPSASDYERKQLARTGRTRSHRCVYVRGFVTPGTSSELRRLRAVRSAAAASIAMRGWTPSIVDDDGNTQRVGG